MSKCENCYHYEMCQSLEDCNKIKKINATSCSFYRDKSLIVELPCEVDDIVYEISNGEIYSLIILNIVITDNSIEFNCMEINEECIDAYGDMDFGVARSFSISDINKTVFINCGDVEKALNAENAV